MSKKQVQADKVDRTTEDQTNCAWDDLDTQALKMYILEEGVSAATLKVHFPWRARQNIERKVTSKDIKEFIAKWNKFNNYLGKAQQKNFDQMIVDKKRTIQELSDDVPHVDSEASTSKGIFIPSNNNAESSKRQRIEESMISNRYLCRPRLDSDANYYYLSLRHSYNTALSWNVIDAANRALECEVIDQAWEMEEWYMLPQCETVKLVNSPKSEISHFIPYVAPNDADVTTASRKVLRSYTPKGAITVLVLPRVTIAGPGRVDCAEIYVNPFKNSLSNPSVPKMTLPQLPDNNNTNNNSNTKPSNEKEKQEENPEFVNPFLNIFRYDDRPPIVGDLVVVKFAEGYYNGKVIAELGNESFNLAYMNGKEFKENPVSLKMKDQTNNEVVEDQWYFKKRNL